MEIEMIAQKQKGAWLRDVHVEQVRKQVLVILGRYVDSAGLNG